MKKTMIFGLLSLVLFLGGCFSQPIENTPPTIIDTSTGNVISTDTMNGDSNISGAINTGILQNTQPTKDIVGTTIPEDRDIEIYLSDYLAGEGIGDYVVAKSLTKGNIITISMQEATKSSVINDEFQYMQPSRYINFIIKDRVIIRSTIESLNRPTSRECKDHQGNIVTCQITYNTDTSLVYRYTDHGVLFQNQQEGSMGGCTHTNIYTFTYVNFDNKPTTFYSVSTESYKATSSDGMNNCVLSEKTLKFFASSDLIDGKNIENEKALPIQAKTTEEAFYKYYKLPQPKN